MATRSLVCFGLSLGNVADDFEDAESHLIFISHYKAEAGTEASLMQESFMSYRQYRFEEFFCRSLPCLEMRLFVVLLRTVGMGLRLVAWLVP